MDIARGVLATEQEDPVATQSPQEGEKTVEKGDAQGA